jgi:anti-sigma28 factor (negative regulator of flagellin synthesis)
MKISRAEVRSAVAAYQAAQRKPQSLDTLGFDSAQAPGSSAARLSLATVAHDAATEPLFRRTMVEALGRRISEGRYFVSSEEIVDRLLGRLIVEFASA